MVESSKSIIWHFEVIPPNTKQALEALSLETWIGELGFYLAGGTALALSAGHRRSVDLDFFTPKNDFDTKSLINLCAKNKTWTTEVEEKNTIYGTLFDTKISFISYPFFMPRQNFIDYGQIKVLQPVDIGVMKIVAISGRGRKRDFFDLYWCAHNIEPLEEIVKKLKDQYPSVSHDYHHLLKSLIYFDDAENDPEPVVYFSADWKTVKRFFQKEIPVLAKKLMRLG